MATLIHESPLGALEIPTIDDAVPAGVPFDIADDIAITLLVQGDIFHLVNVPKITDLRKLAKDAEIPTEGLDAHELIVALAAADVSSILTTAPIPKVTETPNPAADDAATTEEVPA